MFLKLHRDRRGQVFIEALIVIPLLFMIFCFILEFGYLMYNWAVINYYACNTAEVAATKGQFTSAIRAQMAAKISDWTVNGKGYNYDVGGTSLPGALDDNTVYIYGTDMSTPVQRGSYINVNINYPWHFKLFLIDSMMRYITSNEQIRIKVNAIAQSEVFIE